MAPATDPCQKTHLHKRREPVFWRVAAGSKMLALDGEGGLAWLLAVLYLDEIHEIG